MNSVTSTATTVPLGTTSPNTFYQACQDLTFLHQRGYSLTVQESSAMRTANGQFTIPDTTCDAGTCMKARQLDQCGEERIGAHVLKRHG